MKKKKKHAIQTLNYAYEASIIVELIAFTVKIFDDIFRSVLFPQIKRICLPEWEPRRDRCI